MNEITKINRIIEQNVSVRTLEIIGNEVRIEIEIDFEKINGKVEGIAISTITVRRIEAKSYSRNIIYYCLANLPYTLTPALNSFNFNLLTAGEIEIEDDTIGITLVVTVNFDEGAATKYLETKILTSCNLKVVGFWPVVMPLKVSPMPVFIDEKGIIMPPQPIMLRLKNISETTEGRINENMITIDCYTNPTFHTKSTLELKVISLKRKDGKNNVLYPQEVADFELTLALKQVNLETLKRMESMLFLVVYPLNIADQPIKYILSKAQKYTLKIEHISERPSKINIKVFNVVTDTISEIKISPLSSVNELKTLLAKMHQMSSKEFILAYEDTILDDDKRVCDYNLNDSSVIILCYRTPLRSFEIRVPEPTNIFVNKWHKAVFVVLRYHAPRKKTSEFERKELYLSKERIKVTLDDHHTKFRPQEFELEVRENEETKFEFEFMPTKSGEGKIIAEIYRTDIPVSCLVGTANFDFEARITINGKEELELKKANLIEEKAKLKLKKLIMDLTK